MTNGTRTAQRVLWKPSISTTGSSAPSGVHQEEESSLDQIRKHYTVRPVPRTLFRLCAQAVVVVQEFALTCFLLSRHEITTLQHEQQGELVHNQQYVEIATAVLFLALLSAVYYSARADPSRQQDRRSKVRQRSVDAVLLALLLRWVAGTLQSLTASYSSDTVQALALAGMVVHLLFCDYSYANGRQGGEISSSAPQPPARPPFQGGTVSLNAALFSTTLLVSRLPSSSRLSAYLFVSLAIVIFALYPATRHAISVTYPAVYSVATWWITALVCASTILQLLVLDGGCGGGRLLSAFVVVVLTLGFLLPAWKYVLQHAKVFLRGPWDIPPAASMQLDYRVKVVVEPAAPQRK